MWHKGRAGAFHQAVSGSNLGMTSLNGKTLQWIRTPGAEKVGLW